MPDLGQTRSSQAVYGVFRGHSGSFQIISGHLRVNNGYFTIFLQNYPLTRIVRLELNSS